MAEKLAFLTFMLFKKNADFSQFLRLKSAKYRKLVHHTYNIALWSRDFND
jgi:hypothetical protein